MLNHFLCLRLYWLDLDIDGLSYQLTYFVLQALRQIQDNQVIRLYWYHRWLDFHHGYNLLSRLIDHRHHHQNLDNLLFHHYQYLELHLQFENYLFWQKHTLHLLILNRHHRHYLSN